MTTVTITTIGEKIENIIKQKRNYAKNIKNYLDFMEDKVMIRQYKMIQSKDGRLHIIMDLWNKNRESITFNVRKIQGN